MKGMEDAAGTCHVQANDAAAEQDGLQDDARM